MTLKFVPNCSSCLQQQKKKEKKKKKTRKMPS